MKKETVLFCFLVVLIGGITGALFAKAMDERVELELLEPEAGVRCALARAPNAVAINCWRVDE